MIYETGRKVAVQESETPAEEKPEDVAVPPRAEESQEAEAAKEPAAVEQPEEPSIAEEVADRKPESEEQNKVSSRSVKTGSGSAVLVPGYLTSEATAI